MPWRGAPPGERTSQTDMPMRQRMMKPKNAAVCHVQAIQAMGGGPVHPSAPAYNAPRAKPLAM